MKRNLIISSIAVVSAALFQGCNSDGNPAPDPQTYITFGIPGVSMTGIDVSQSRSTLLTTDQLSEFEVAGFCIPQKISDVSQQDPASATASWNDKSMYSKADVFGNNKVKVTVSGESTTYTPTKQWYENVSDPWDAKYTFIAWANAGKGSFTTSNLATMQVPVVTYTMPFSGGSSGNKQLLNHTDVSDAVVAATFDHTRRQGNVDLRFEHLLTGISFRFRNYTSKTLTITGLSLEGHFYRKVDISFESDKMKQTVESLDAGGYWGVFSLVTSDNEQAINANSSAMLTHTDGKQLTILLLPNPDVDPTNTVEDKKDQYALGANKNIIISYRLEGDTEDRKFTIEDFHLSYNPAQSTRHTATLNFIGDEFTLIFQAKNDDVWENGSDNDILIN